MLQLRKKLFAGSLCALMLLTTSVSAWSEAADDVVAEQPDGAETDAPDEGAEGGEITAPVAKPQVSEAEALAKMVSYAKTDSLELLVNEETNVFAIKLSNGKYIWSNPYNASGDAYANEMRVTEMSSAIVINPVNLTDSTAGSSSNLYSAGSATTQLTKTENGFKALLKFNKEGITLPYSVELKDDYFEVTIDVAGIYEIEVDDPANARSASCSIKNINVFQDLSAGGLDEEGYMVVPDGSGAVIEFNNGKSDPGLAYLQQMYGRDLAISQTMAGEKTENAYLPILGIVKDDYALLEVVTSGSAYASAHATVSRQRSTSYNSAWFSFSLRSSDQYYMGSSANALTAFERSRVPESAFSVRYYPLEGQDKSYVDIAQRYQKYLVDTGMLVEKKTNTDSPFYLDVYGGTVQERSVVGFPVKLETSATTYAQAQEILEEFRNRGVTNIILTYEDFNKAGITGRVSNAVEYSGTLGGKKEFAALKSYCDSNNIMLVPAFDLMEYERSGNGYSKTGASVIAVTKAYATQTPHELAFGTPSTTRSSWYILTPAYFTKVYNQVVTSCKSEGLSAISVTDGTNILYSDFNVNPSKITCRGQTITYLQECYQKVVDSGLTFVANACNDYALKYVDYIKDAPLYSSGYDIYDYDIPLYEIVIHGYVPYSTKAKNASSSADELFLLSVATGTGLHYEVMYENPNDFTNCSYDTLFYAFYKGWLDIAASEYKICEEYVKPVMNAKIKDFRYLDNLKTVVETTFDNGTVITADLKNLTLKVNGKDVNLAEYGWEGAAIG